ncbi:MAG: copper resistance protein NlpE [Brachymonas sp.]|nr:copper resistance protein NlpE [Brachymonas sp.]
MNKTDSGVSRLRWVSASAALLLFLGGCTVVSLPPPQPVRRPPPPVVVQPAVAGWTGTYRTVLPCPDCAGLKVELSLYKDGTFDIMTHELGTSRPAITRRGGFVFNADETRITLDANGQGRSFDILPPNGLRMLGRDGQPVTGADAQRFILRK